jgi:hypothetical protein
LLDGAPMRGFVVAGIAAGASIVSIALLFLATDLPGSSRPRVTFRGGIVSAARILAGRKQTAVLILASCVCQTLVMAQATLYPAHFSALPDGGAPLYAFHAIAYGVGALVAPLAADRWLLRHGTPHLRVSGLVALFGLAMLGLATSSAAMSTYGSIVVLAAVNSMLRIERTAEVFVSIDSEFQGRVGGLLEAGVTAANVVVALLSSVLADVGGVAAVWYSYAALAGVLLASIWRIRSSS